MYSGLQYFIETQNITGSLQLFYDFGGNNSNVISNLASGKSQYFGDLNNIQGFYSSENSGFFGSGNYVIPKNVSEVNQNFSTLFISFQTSSPQQGTLFSNYKETSGIKSGYALGLNAANKLIFETWNENEPFIVESALNLYNKNIISFTKYNDSLSFGLYNIDANELKEETFAIPPGTNLISNDWSIGKDINSPNYFSGGNLNGYIDNLLYFSDALEINQKKAVCSGFFCDIVTGGFIDSIEFSSGIIGGSYQDIIVGTGFLGYKNVLIGQVTGDYGDVTDIYQNVPTYGPIIENQYIPVYGYTPTYSYTEHEQIPIINPSIKNSYGPNAFTYLKKINNLDFSEYYCYSGNHSGNLNRTPFFNSINSNFYIENQDYLTSNINIYKNSVAQYPVNVGNLDNCFSLSGQNISGKFSTNDNLIMDTIRGTSYLKTIDDFFLNSGKMGIHSFTPNDYGVFSNGVKLISGIHYEYRDINLIINDLNLFTISDFKLLILPFPKLSYINNGIMSNKKTITYTKNNSMLFLNGLRQKINIDYTELGSRSLLLGSGIFLDT